MVDLFRTITGWWIHSNDIYSPTLEGDINEELNKYVYDEDDTLPDEFQLLSSEDFTLLHGQIYNFLKFLRLPENNKITHTN